MRKQSGKTCLYPALTLMETVISLAIMAIIFAVLLPQIRAIQNSWDSNAHSAETLQNGRVLIDHLNRNLSKAARITAVSDSNTASGYIEFEDSASSTLRYDIAANNYVEFGAVGSLNDLAGPVSQLLFACYDGNDMVTAITDGNDIRLVNVQAILTNASAGGRDLTVETSVYLRTGPLPSAFVDPNLVLWLMLDETSGTTAADSSGNGNDGTLTYMNPNADWVAGQIGNALDFDGDNDYVAVAHADDFLLDNGTVALWFTSDDVSDWGELFSKDSSGYDTGGHLSAYLDSSRVTVRLQSTGTTYYVSSGSTLQDDTWYHMAMSWGSGGMKLYFDGSQVDTYSYTGGLGTTSGGIGNYEPLALGASTQTSGNLTITPLQDYFDGMLDDVRVYDYALDPTEIAALDTTLRFQEFTEARAETDTTSIVLATPASTSAGNLLIIAVATDGDTSASLAPPAGEGWTEVFRNEESGEVTIGVWWKLADASESASHEFTWSGSQQAYAWMMRFTGHDPADPLHDYSADGETDQNPTSAPVTTTVDNCLILRLGAFDDRDITVDSPGLTNHTAITMDGSGLNLGLVVQWKLDESSGTTAADSSGNGYDGTLTNMNGNEWTTGTLDGALEFDGSDELVSCGNLDVTGGDGHITLTAWMKADDFGTSDARFISKATGTSTSQHYWMLSTWNGSQLRFRLRTSSTQNLYSSSGVLSTGVWTHVAATWDGSTMRVYRNATDVGSTSKSGTLATNGSVGVAIGNQPPGAGNRPFDGLIDDVRIYNRALSAAELVDVAAGLGGGPPASGGVVSGGAGYVKQGSSGSSGWSNFSLTASEEARTVTIAIAPVP